jgi:predicted O-linked N-acetylglucosamine transferase (SPINDLY family)
MRILNAVEGSVLWLLEDNPYASRNLRLEAANRGIDPNRLVFAKNMPLPDHLARHQFADLFLDTTPYNAHTTASDALWTGLPVLSLIGQSFAGRVAASLLNAIGVPELIVNSQEDYERLAIQLARNTETLLRIREKLNNNRLKTPLFDSELFTRNLEDVYMKMYHAQHTNLSAQ